ncbi:heavy-metal-associated domain-containing protein [Mariniflexile maritimum]|jgi:Cu+-exporting ATPase|uniref:heavy-metal-associated domain-containing protein n=1 Tax=Mariniflexile maritimum TaxID=2682493 RepID=UPI0012F6F397|nr:heavy metal-associated domain-containing protein [Mariniflexile maritimum]MCB0448983.1 heavy-metal-associated domain-containing protein [Confluentibacter sp.]
MNVPKNILIVSLMALFVMNCKNDAKQPEVKTVETATEASATTDPNATYAKAEFKIDGMTCAVGCAATIEKKMAKMDGVKWAKVDFDKKLAMVEYDIAKVSPTNLVETVAKVGDAYKVSDMKTVETFSEQ